jgi:hypothetical protein
MYHLKIINASRGLVHEYENVTLISILIDSFTKRG